MILSKSLVSFLLSNREVVSSNVGLAFVMYREQFVDRTCLAQ